VGQGVQNFRFSVYIQQFPDLFASF
jgi:hypothetical protein